MAKEKGLNRFGDIIAWLKLDFGLGLGHARAIADVILHEDEWKLGTEAQVAKHFTGPKAHWRTTYDDLSANVNSFGPGVTVSPAASYISLLRDNKKFAVVHITANRMDIGIKRKGVPAEGRFEEAGAWNNMVTHRVKIADAGQIDSEVLAWLRQAYDHA